MFTRKYIHKASPRIQTMLLRFMKYNLYVNYQPGPTLYIADTPSRAYVEREHESDDIEVDPNMRIHSLVTNLPISNQRKQKLQCATAEDVSLWTAHSMWMSVACVRRVCLSPPDLFRGVCCRHYFMPCTLILTEMLTQTITTSNMQTTLRSCRFANWRWNRLYKSNIDHFVSRCVANCLELNVIKTKEIVIDFRSDVHHPNPID